jgi:O-antigen ligase
MLGLAYAWLLSTVLSIGASAYVDLSLVRSAWTLSPWHKNDMALLPLILAFLPWWMLAPGSAVILVSGSRNALLGLLVVTLLRLRGLWRWGALGGIVGTLIALAAREPYLLTRGTARLGHWLVALQMWMAAPWLGQGPFTFTEFYAKWLPATLPFGITPQVAAIPWAHNLYLEVLAERGLLGFAIFAGVATWTLLRGRRATRTAMLAFLTMGLFDLTFLKAWVSLAFWGLAWTAETA